MRCFRLVFNKGFLLFLLGVYGPSLASYTQKLISTCNANIFTFCFMFVLYIVLSSSNFLRK